MSASVCKNVTVGPVAKRSYRGIVVSKAVESGPHLTVKVNFSVTAAPDV